MTDIILSLSSAFAIIPWCSDSLIQHWVRTAVSKVQEAGAVQKWSVAECRGSHRGVKMSEDSPPRVSQDLKDAVKILLRAAKSEGVKLTSACPEGELLKAIVTSELASQWTEPTESHDTSYTARSIHFMLAEEYTLLQKLAALPLNTWQAAMQ